MRFVYSSDIHGDINKYHKLLNICKKNNINYIVLGGDLLPKYKDDREPIQRDFINNEFDKYCRELQDNNITLIGILGNDDLEIIEEDYYKVISKYPNIIDVDNKLAKIEDISFIGLNKVIDAPFKRKDHIVLDEDQVMPKQASEKIYIDSCKRILTIKEWEKERLKRPKMSYCLNKLPKSNGKTIYILHDPPANIGLDWCRDGDKAGSKDIYNFLYNSNAYMSLHGHIHESYSLSGIWNAKINKTIAIQLGQTELNEELLYYAIIDTDNNKYERYEE